MVDSKINQEFNKFIEFLEKYLKKSTKYAKNQMSSLKVILLNTDEPLDDSKLSTIFIKLYRLLRYKCYKLKTEYQTGVLTIKKKTIAISTASVVGLTSAFIFTFNGDLVSTDVNAIDSGNTTSTSVNSDLQFPTLSINGQRFATDAKLISDKLRNYDFYNNGDKVVYLTFDDGPSKYTPEILQVLKKYNVRGTFFTTGTALENGGSELGKVLKESYNYGNSIGNHTYSHDYKTLYPNGSLNISAFNSDIERNLTLLKNALGENFDTNIVRCPGGFNSWKGMDKLKSQLDLDDKVSVDWNALTDDSSSTKNNPKEMINNAIETSKDKNLVVLLMHETNQFTPEYLDDVIRYFHSSGYEFKTLA